MKKKQLGQTLLEALIALSTAVVIISAMTVIVLSSLSNAQFSRNQNQATLYAQQGIEFLKNLAQSDWASFTANTQVNYCLSPLSKLPASFPPVVSAPPPHLGFFSKLANLIQKFGNLGEREVSSVFSKLASIPQTVFAAVPEHPLQDKGLGAANFSVDDYNMGYTFTPNVNGQITQLGLRCDSGTRIVRLFDATGTTVLASASVTAAGTSTWVYAPITPVSVTAGTRYIVAQRSGANHYCYNNFVTPFTQGSITVNSSNNKPASDNMISSAVAIDYMHGQADVGFELPAPTPTPTPPPPTPTPIPTPTPTPTPTLPPPTPTPTPPPPASSQLTSMPLLPPYCGQNLGIFSREVTIQQSPSAPINPLNTCIPYLNSALVSVSVGWSDNKCTNATDVYCHKVKLVSCIYNSPTVPAP